MNLLEISTRTAQNLGNPSSPTTGVIMFWYRHNIGTLNNLLNSSYVIDAANGAISPDLGEQEGSIFMSLYMIYYWGNKVNECIGAAGYDHVLEVAENGAVTRLVNKGTLALSFIQLKKQEQENLDNLVNFYRSNSAVPQSIDGEDTTEEFYNGNNGVHIRTID